MEDKIISLSAIRENQNGKYELLKQLNEMPFYIKEGGEVLTREQHEDRKRRKEEIERKAKDKL